MAVIAAALRELISAGLEGEALAAGRVEDERVGPDGVAKGEEALVRVGEPAGKCHGSDPRRSEAVEKRTTADVNSASAVDAGNAPSPTGGRAWCRRR